MHALSTIKPHTSIAVGFKNATPLRHICVLLPARPPPPFVSPRSSHSVTLLTSAQTRTFSASPVVLARESTHNAARHPEIFSPKGLNFRPKMRLLAVSFILIRRRPVLSPAPYYEPNPRSRSQFDHFTAFQNGRGSGFVGEFRATVLFIGTLLTGRVMAVILFPPVPSTHTLFPAPPLLPSTRA